MIIRSGIAQLQRRHDPPTGILIHDTFTDTNGVTLANHTPDIDVVGGGWAESAAVFDIQSNKLRMNSVSATVRYAKILAPISDVSIEWTANWEETGNTQARAIARVLDFNNWVGGLMQNYSTVPWQWCIYKYEGAVGTILVNDYGTTGSGTLVDVLCRLTILGNDFLFEVPSENLYMTATTSFLAGQKAVGTSHYKSGAGTISNLIDNFKVQPSLEAFPVTGTIVPLLSGSGNWTVPPGVTSIHVMVVGGGGGSGMGGNYWGGGGGSGRVVYNAAYATTPGANIAYSVGAGGPGATSTSVKGSKGTNSTFGTITAIGGGGGGSPYSKPGATGGSGGGSAYNSTGGAADASQGGWGNAGSGCSGGYNGGGGGGGAGTAPGANNPTGGRGYDMRSVFGITYGDMGFFGGGGSGAWTTNTPYYPRYGGTGGGGDNGVAGRANTGGGGGLAWEPNSTAGGSGIILIKYT